MRKKILFLLTVVLFFVSCKKKDERVSIDMTLKEYSADTKWRQFPIILQLKFKKDGTVVMRAFPSEDEVILKYEVADPTAEKTNLRIYGELEEGLYADGLSKGTKIDWTANISRLLYKAEVNGFTMGEYHFMSY